MFKKPTVFILGAGSSCHYGYPTGEGLVERVVQMTDRFASYCENRQQSGYISAFVPDYVEQRLAKCSNLSNAWISVRDECHLLSHRLRTIRPLVIDFFLAWNKSLEGLGTFMIAAALLECEMDWFENRRQRQQSSSDGSMRHEIEKAVAGTLLAPTDWYRFLTHKLVYGCKTSKDLLKNSVNFITFNYDTSLEHELFNILDSMDILARSDVEDFLAEDRIIHMYGKLNEQPYVNESLQLLPAARALGSQFLDRTYRRFERDYDGIFSSKKAFLDFCLRSSSGIRTVDPGNKVGDGVDQLRAQRWIRAAEVMYIFGYGFDENNNQRLGLDDYVPRMNEVDKVVMYTNYGDTKTIEKRAQAATDAWLLTESSSGNVYAAVEKDFEAFGNG